MTSIRRPGLIATLTRLAPAVAAALSRRRAPRQPAPPDPPVAWWVLTCAGLCSTLLTCGWLIAGALEPDTYSPMHQTVSVLAGRAGTHRWIVTTALFAVGVCYIVTATGMTALRRSARIGLVLTGAAGIGIALCPEPVRGNTIQHMACASIGATTIAVWPALTARRGPRAPAIVSVPVATTATAVFMALLAWLFFEAQTDGRVGLAERVDASIQALWPFVVAVALRPRRRGAQASAVAAGTGPEPSPATASEATASEAI
jgi:hypothetical membrane protein